MAPSVTNPLMGEIRFAWWSEGLEEIAQGRPARAPVLEALRPAAADGRLDRAALDRLIEARHADLAPEPPADEPALLRYLEDTAGALMLAAARLLAPETRPESVAAAGSAWGWTRWLEAARREDAQRWRPATWAGSAIDEVERHVAAQAHIALAEARPALRTLSPAAFPAVSYLALAPALLNARPPGPLDKRLHLFRATLTGRV